MVETRHALSLHLPDGLRGKYALFAFPDNPFHVLPEAGIGLAHHLGVLDGEGAEEGCRGERQGHAVVVVGGDGGVGGGGAAGAVPGQCAVGGFVQHVTQLAQFVDERGDAVCFFDFQAMQPGEVEGDVPCAAGYHEGLGQVGLVGEVVLHVAGGELAVRGDAHAAGQVFGGDAQGQEQVGHPAVALQAVGLQPVQEHLSAPREGEHFVPIGGGGPVALHGERHGAVRLRADVDGLVRERGRYAERLHQSRRHADVGARHHPPGEADAQPALHVGGYHHEGGDVLAAHAAVQVYLATREGAAVDAQGRVAGLPGVFHPCAEAVQRVDQDADGALLHALAAGDGPFAEGLGQEGGEEAHGGARRSHVEVAVVAVERTG